MKLTERNYEDEEVILDDHEFHSCTFKRTGDAMKWLTVLLCLLSTTIPEVFGQDRHESGEASAKTVDREFQRAVAHLGSRRVVDASVWGEDISNPLMDLPAKMSARLKKAAADPDQLGKLSTRLLTGQYYGEDAKSFVNPNRDVLLVLGKGFATHGAILSLGPILVVENARVDDVAGWSLVWFVENSRAGKNVAGRPLVSQSTPEGPEWHRPKLFLAPLGRAEKPWAEPARDYAAKKKRLEMVCQEASGVDINKLAPQIENPFKTLSQDGKLRLRARGIEPARLEKLQARALAGKQFGVAAATFLNNNPATVLVLGKGFESRADIFSLGPVVAREDCTVSGRIVSADLVWIVDEAIVKSTVTGLPVIVAPTARHNCITPPMADLWSGDYGLPSAKGARVPRENPERPFPPKTADSDRDVGRVWEIDATTWGEDVANPLANLDPPTIKWLKAKGIDGARLAKLEARLLPGSHGSSVQRRFVNRDPNIVLILGKGYESHLDKIKSAGPVLALGNARVGRIECQNLVWSIEGTLGEEIAGRPYLKSGDTPKPKWLPESLSFAHKGRSPKPWSAPAKDYENKRQRLQEAIKSQSGVDVTRHGEKVDNPLLSLSEQGKEKLAYRGIGLDRLLKMKAYRLKGNYLGATAKTFVNKDAETIVVLSSGFVTHGDIYSIGPVLATSNAQIQGNITCSDIIWFADESFPRGRTVGLPIIVSPTSAYDQAKVSTKDVWFGDYGFRSHKD